MCSEGENKHGKIDLDNDTKRLNFLPAHFGPTQKLAHPFAQDFPGAGINDLEVDGVVVLGVVGSICLAARHSLTRGIIGPLNLKQIYHIKLY